MRPSVHKKRPSTHVSTRPDLSRCRRPPSPKPLRHTNTPRYPACPALKTPPGPSLVSCPTGLPPWPRNGRQTTGRAGRGSTPWHRCRRPAVALSEQLGPAWQPSPAGPPQPQASQHADLPGPAWTDRPDMGNMAGQPWTICTNMRWPPAARLCSAGPGFGSGANRPPLARIPIWRLAPPLPPPPLSSHPMRLYNAEGRRRRDDPGAWARPNWPEIEPTNLPGSPKRVACVVRQDQDQTTRRRPRQIGRTALHRGCSTFLAAGLQRTLTGRAAPHDGKHANPLQDRCRRMGGAAPRQGPGMTKDSTGRRMVGGAARLVGA